jgi:hypothetical protein
MGAARFCLWQFLVLVLAYHRARVIRKPTIVSWVDE